MARKPSNMLPSPSVDLAQRIVARIGHEERRRRYMKAVVFGMALIASTMTVVYASSAAAAEAAHTGFWTFFSLLFTDFGATIASFSDFILSISESFPAFSVAVLLAGAFFAVWSASKFIKEIGLLRRRSFS